MIFDANISNTIEHSFWLVPLFQLENWDVVGWQLVLIGYEVLGRKLWIVGWIYFVINVVLLESGYG